MKYYKFTQANGETYGGYHWPLPTKNADGTWTPGEWTTPIEGKLKPCANGYHVTDFKNIFDWMDEEMYEVEYRGRKVAHEDGDKWVVRQARLVRRVETYNDKTLRIYAVWCARNALKTVDNPDPRSIAVCDVAERFANGKATEQELAAAEDAAWDAAWAAAEDAARAAAWAAARAAAEDAARAAAWDVQLKQLRKMLGE